MCGRDGSFLDTDSRIVSFVCSAFALGALAFIDGGRSRFSRLPMGESLAGVGAAGNFSDAAGLDSGEGRRTVARRYLVISLVVIPADVSFRHGEAAEWRSSLAKFHGAVLSLRNATFADDLRMVRAPVALRAA